MAEEVIRIFSDIHYGDRASRVARLEALAPLAEGADRWVINGDTTDTRPGGPPELTRQLRGEIGEFLRRSAPPTTLLTGNHDPDISPFHFLELAQRRLFLTHGDALYEDIVPWGRDAPLIRRLFAEERERQRPPLPAEGTAELLAREMALLRKVAAATWQRHQSERRPGRYWARLTADLLWPPWRVPRTFQAWWSLPRRARAFGARHRLPAQILCVGHTHRPGLWRREGGPAIVNTGALCPPFSGWAIDLQADSVRVRPIETRGGEFRVGSPLAELRLSPKAR